MTRLLTVFLLSSAVLLSCQPKQKVVLDPTKAYRLAEDADVKVWAPVGPGAYVKTPTTFHEGDWCASSGAVEGK